MNFIANGQIGKHKAWLVAKGFCQHEGIDYTKTFAPFVKMSTKRTIISLVASYQWKIHQMYVKSVFFSVDLLEDIYMNNYLVLFLLTLFV